MDFRKVLFLSYLCLVGCIDEDGDGVRASIDCNDTDPNIQFCLSCLDIQTINLTSRDGNYWIDPDSSGEFEVYCDMTTDGGGWTLLSNLGNCTSGLPVSSLTLQDSCSYLEVGLVNVIALNASDVMLKTGSSVYNLNEVTQSTNDLAVTALQTPTGNWHNGATWSDWDFIVDSSNPDCSPDNILTYVTGWPQMYVGCGFGSSVHWIQSSSDNYFHQRVLEIDNGMIAAHDEVATTWIR